MLEELFCAHRAELTAYCRGLCRSDAAAQDMVQEVFLRAWQNIGTLQDLGPSQRRAWLYRTARNLFVDAVRRTAREAAALPELPPRLRIVYGNKWVDGRFNAFMNTRLSLFLIETDYVPAFLATPFEVCLYLFMMDYCIIKENYSKVKDEDLRQFLHIFRPSPMLKIKGLL